MGPARRKGIEQFAGRPALPADSLSARERGFCVGTEIFADSVPGPRDSSEVAVDGQAGFVGLERSTVLLSILMAVFNEERTVAAAVEEVLAINYPCDIELIVVDDGSTDGTPELLALISDPRVVVHQHESNRGKGAALISAATLATGSHVVPFDADLEYAAEDIARMLSPVLSGRCNVVYGTRLFGFNTVYPSYWFAIGNKLLTRIANIVYDAYLGDLHTCLKLMPTELLRHMKLREVGFGLDTEITAWLLRAGIRPFEVPVRYFGRSRSQGKKITWRDAIRCVRILLRVKFTRSFALRAETELGLCTRDAEDDPSNLLMQQIDDDYAPAV